MNKKYYTLAIKENGKWFADFGDYSKAVVSEERQGNLDADRYARRDMIIVTTGENQIDIDNAIDALNGY